MKNRVARGLAAILAVVVLGEGRAARPASLPAVPTQTADAADDFGRTPLMLAAFNGNTAAAQALLRQGAPVNARDKNEMTALTWAAPEVIALLLRSGADVHARDRFGRTALSYAAYREDAATMRALLAAGSLLEVRDEDGRTPLFFALYGGCTRGGDGRWPLKETILWQLGRGPHQDRCIDAVKILLDRGADVNARDGTGQTPLVFFARMEMLSGARDDRRLVEYLLEKGAEVNASDREGNTALMGRAHWGDAPMVQLLLERGAGSGATTLDGRTALSMASAWPTSWGAKGQVKALLLAAEAARALGKAKKP